MRRIKHSQHRCRQQDRYSKRRQILSCVAHHRRERPVLAETAILVQICNLPIRALISFLCRHPLMEHNYFDPKSCRIPRTTGIRRSWRNHNGEEVASKATGDLAGEEIYRSRKRELLMMVVRHQGVTEPQLRHSPVLTALNAREQPKMRAISRTSPCLGAPGWPSKAAWCLASLDSTLGGGHTARPGL